MIPKNIYPKSPIRGLRREDYANKLETAIDTATAAAVVGMSYNFLVRAIGLSSGSRPRSVTLGQVLDLLDLDEYEETFVPRSMVPDYLLRVALTPGATAAPSDAIQIPADSLSPTPSRATPATWFAAWRQEASGAR